MDQPDKTNTQASPPMDWRDVDLSTFNNAWWSPGRSGWVITLWRLIGLPLLKHTPCEVAGEGFWNAFRVWLLRRFGATIGKGVVIRNCEVYYPWNLEVSDHVWIGYEANLYSLVKIRLGNHVCVSQQAYLCAGSHDVSEPSFGLIVGEITLKDASWACARSFIGPGVTLHEGAVAAAGSVVVKDVPEMTIVGGNPARPIKQRQISPRE